MADDAKSKKDPARWEQRYVAGDVPWDADKPDFHLQWAIADFDVRPCRVVDIGCGTGVNSVWLDEAGFEVTGLDISPTAVARAQARAASAGADCQFLTADLMAGDLPFGDFGVACDRGCFHCFDDAEDRDKFAAHVADLLEPEGLWISLLGSTDGPPRESGPPRRSLLDIAQAMESYFEILHLESTVFDQHDHAQARAWLVVARKRIQYIQ